MRTERRTRRWWLSLLMGGGLLLCCASENTFAQQQSWPQKSSARSAERATIPAMFFRAANSSANHGRVAPAQMLVAPSQSPQPALPVLPLPATDSPLESSPRLERLPPADAIPAQLAALQTGEDVMFAPPPPSANLPVPIAMAMPPNGASSFCGPSNAAEQLMLGIRANGEAQSHCLLSTYFARVADTASRPSCADTALPPLPVDFRPWWDEQVRRQSAVCRAPRNVTIDALIDHALRYSSYVQLVTIEPSIQRTSIIVEQADFDWRTFVDTTYKKTNDPVGNVLTTGNGATIFRDRTWTMNGGLRQKNITGGELSITQKLSTQENNSRFLLPNPQGTSRLELSYTQPLLNGAGKCLNESRIVLAQLDTSISEDDAIQKLQDHLVKVTESYWELYRARAEYFQRIKLLNAAQMTMNVLSSREEVDATSQQVLRARAAVISRRSEIIRVQTVIRNAESQLRLLVNSPELVAMGPHEMAPADSPLLAALPISMQDSLQTALISRPDISQSIRAIRASAVRLGVAENQVLPKLDFIGTTYVAGLAGHHEFFNAVGQQFSTGFPGYSYGFVFEMPWGNRAALARQEQRQLEMNRALAAFRLTVEESLTATEVAVREMETSYREMLNHYQAIIAAENEVDYLFNRWKTIPGVEDSAAFLLENLLDAQARLADEEASMVRSQVNYALSIVKVKRQMGTLLKAKPCTE